MFTFLSWVPLGVSLPNLGIWLFLFDLLVILQVNDLDLARMVNHPRLIPILFLDAPLDSLAALRLAQHFFRLVLLLHLQLFLLSALEFGETNPRLSALNKLFLLREVFV